jgi:nucleoside-diphosphate-sugar epimerase
MAVTGGVKRVLLTGATGFICPLLARLIESEGLDVATIVRPGAYRWRLADIEPRLSLIRGDLRAFAGMLDKIRLHRPEICIHPARDGSSGKAEAETNLSSLGVSIDVPPAMVEVPCGRLVAAGTCFEVRSRTCRSR